MRFAVLMVAALLFLALFGCTGQAMQQNQANPQVPAAQQTPANGELANQAQNASGLGAIADGAGAGRQANQAGNAPSQVAGAGGETGLSFSEWKAPDGSITLQVPEGWKASERRVDNCTVSWAVQNPERTSSAFMNNQIMVFKSESARQMYKAYGMAGIDSVPVSGYLGAKQALSQVIAPLSGSSNVRVLGSDAALSSQFSQAACIPGLAACDAQAFEAAFDYKGTLMRGYYLVQTYDFGEGTTWWINLWGYEAPAADWEKTVGTAEKAFTSVKVTEEWAARCGGRPGRVEGVISEVVKSRQAAAEKSAEEWGKYIRGE